MQGGSQPTRGVPWIPAVKVVIDEGMTAGQLDVRSMTEIRLLSLRVPAMLAA